MRKFLVAADGRERELSPLTEAEFTKLGLWTGSSTTAFSRWLTQNNLVALQAGLIDRYADCVLVLRSGERELLFKPNNDDTWVPYSTLLAIEAQYSCCTPGAGCAQAATRYLAIWQPGFVAPAAEQ